MSGRPKGRKNKAQRSLTDSAKKKKKKEAQKKYTAEKTRLHLLLSNEERQAWEEMKTDRNIKTNMEGFRFLLDL